MERRRAVNAIVFQVAWYIFSLIVAGGLICSGFIKLFARQVPYWRALLISASAWAVAAVLMASFYVAKSAFGFSQWWVESIACAFGLSVAGLLMTRLARKYGVQKTGKLGVGAKSILSFIAAGWVFFGVLYALLMLAPAP
jgi:hypothetical protein